MLKKALKSIYTDDTRTLHCLRHTFAVMRYLQTRDIYSVRTELGHASVVMTEMYANFDVRKLEEDFPSLVSSNRNHIKSLWDTISWDTNQKDTYTPVANYG